MQLILWVLLSAAAFVLVQYVYVVSQACIGRWNGIKVDEVSIGYDLGFLPQFRWRGKNWDWKIGLLLVGSHTKFRNEYTDDEKLALGISNDDERAPKFPPDSFNHASFLTKSSIFLIGPFSSLFIGVVCLVIPVVVGSNKVRVSTPQSSTIQPVAVGGIEVTKDQSDWSGQFEFCSTILSKCFLKYFLFFPLEGWGGLIGALITSGAAGSESYSFWLTCIGVICLYNFVSNLLPIPILNGGHFLFHLWEHMTGQKIAEKVSITLTMIGLIFMLVVYVRIFVADIIWLLS